jgi:hypothetical protein
MIEFLQKMNGKSTSWGLVAVAVAVYVRSCESGDYRSGSLALLGVVLAACSMVRRRRKGE